MLYIHGRNEKKIIITFQKLHRRAQNHFPNQKLNIGDPYDSSHVFQVTTQHRSFPLTYQFPSKMYNRFAK